MKKSFHLLLGMFLLSNICIAQAKPPAIDINKLMKMTPAEREAYKEQVIKQQSDAAVTIAKKNNLNVDVTTFPGYEIKPPVKNVAKLALIPSRPPTRQELVSGVQQSIDQLKQGIPAPKMQEIQQFSASQSIAAIHDAAVMSFYNNNPSEAVMLMMKAVSKAPDSLLIINNLGAILNLTGVEHKAIPLLQYCLDKLPESSTVLNNLGQGFMGLGDLPKATDYFTKCLAIDSLHVEANHSMGMLHMFKKEYDQAMKYFEREMSVAMRKSTMARAYKMGKKFNLREIARRKHNRNGRPQKNHFEEITMGKFAMPSFPATAAEIKLRKPELDAYSASVQMEAMFWLNLVNTTNMNAAKRKGDQYPGIYSDLAKAMLEELHKEFTPQYLYNYTDADARWIKDRMETGALEINKVKCPEPPAGMSLEAQHAMEVKCCEEKRRPLADATVAALGGYLQPILSVGQQRWKSYINQLVAIAELDPDAANQSMVYGAVSGYFNYLSWGSLYFTTGDINNLLVMCEDDYKQQEMDSIIASDQLWRMNCPAWLNVEVDLGGAAIKADCNKYVIEAGQGIVGAFEHEFKSGKSTLLLGPGVRGEFLKGMVKLEAKTQVYITFDNNKEFSDFGVKNTLEAGVSGTPIGMGPIKLGGNVAGIEISNSMGINSGYQESVEKKGVIAEWFK